MTDAVEFDTLREADPAGVVSSDGQANIPGRPWRLHRALPYLQALAIYLSSRLLVFLGVAFGKAYIPLGNDTWLGGTSWFHRLLRWDSEWYQIIATHGYSYNGNPDLTQTVVFYPLYPLLSRLVGGVLHIEVIDAMLLVANLAAAAAMLLLFKLVRERFDDGTARATVAMTAFFPGSVFLSAGYTEPLVLLLMVAFFLCLARERFFAAAVFAGLAVATRSSGIVLCPVLLWTLWRARPWRAFAIEAVPLAIVATSGLWLYMIYLGIAFGHPMAFADAQAAFHENSTLAARLLSALTLAPFLKMNLTDVSPAGLDPWFTLLFIALIVCACFSSLNRGMILFAVLVLALPYLTLSGGPAGFTSMARFNLVSFPLFIVLAQETQRWRWMTPAVVGVFGGLLLIYAALFSQWQWVG